MKKTVIGLSLVLSSLLAGNLMAQTSSAAVGCSKSTACAQTEGCTRPDTCCARGEFGRPDPFAGLNLTEDQQTRLKAIKPCGNADKKCDKADKKCDKKMDAKDRQARREAAKKARQEYLAGVKTILTPEQYVVFLENFYVAQAPGRAGHMHGNKDMKQGKNKKFGGKDMKQAKGGDRKLDRPDGKRPAPKSEK